MKKSEVSKTGEMNCNVFWLEGYDLVENPFELYWDDDFQIFLRIIRTGNLDSYVNLHKCLFHFYHIIF